MDKYFHSSFCDVLIRGYLCSPTDKKNLDDAMEEPSIVVQFGFDEVHELVIRTDVESMYPTGELVFRSSKIDTMTKIMMQQITFLKLDVEVSHMEGGTRKTDKADTAYYAVSKIVENKDLEDEYETKDNRDRFYNIYFDSVRKLNLHGSCIYSSYKDDSTGEPIAEIMKKLFKDIGIELNIDYVNDKTRIPYLTSNNATVRSSFMYLLRRMFNGYATDTVDIPFLSYDAFGNEYQLVSLNGLEKREQDKSDEMSGIIDGDTWMFHVVAGNENAALNEDTDKTYFEVRSGYANKNDVIKTFYNRTRTDYDCEMDSFGEGKNVEVDHLVRELLVVNPPEDEKIGSNFKMVPSQQFLDVIDKDFEWNKGKFTASYRATTFRENVFTLDYLKPLIFGSDRIILDTPGNLVRTLGDMVTVKADDDPESQYRIKKYQGKYIIAGIAHRFFRKDDAAIYRNGLDLVTPSTTQSEIEVA